jgi:esterase/lipase superfamily enzyme
MYREELVQMSGHLNREMHMMIYGHDGLPLLAFPTQDSMCRNYEDFGLTDQIHDYLDSGQVQLFVVDTVDAESWSLKSGAPVWRAARQEQYFHYIIDEALPFIASRNGQAPIVMGLSMGADHAAITFLRKPDLFRGMLALSGVYDADYFFNGFMNATLYDNSPERFLPNMPYDHPYINIYNQKRIIFCVGQGAWEEDGVRTLRNLQHIFAEKGIHAWCDFWGHDVNHDWPWWFKQIRYFLPYLLGENQ